MVIRETTKEKNRMSLLDDRTLIILDNGFVRTRDKNGELIEPKFDTKTVYPIPKESGDSDKSSDKATSPINVNINLVVQTH